MNSIETLQLKSLKNITNKKRMYTEFLNSKYQFHDASKENKKAHHVHQLESAHKKKKKKRNL